MNFLIRKLCCGITRTMLLEDVIDQNEAISKAKKEAEKITEEDATVALFTENARPICGWFVKGGNLKEINNTYLEQIKLQCDVTSTTFSEEKEWVKNTNKRVKRSLEKSEKLRIDDIVK